MKHSVPARRKTARLPPLGFMRTFEAAARHQSFTLAAEELLVTQSAVSQQIRQLEDFLEVRLFRRLPRRLELTREGVPLAAAAREAMALISHACDALADPDAPAILSVNAAPEFASCWLSQRMKSFMEEQRNLRITLLSSNDPVDFRRQDVDVAIRWGRGGWKGVHATQLGTGELVPICSPDYLGGGASIAPQEFGAHTLLQVMDQGYWSQWAGQEGFPSPNRDSVLYFSDAGLMVAAARQAQGIALAPACLVAGDLASGDLLCPLPGRVRADAAFWLLCDEEMAEKPRIAAFREWIKAALRES